MMSGLHEYCLRFALVDVHQDRRMLEAEAAADIWERAGSDGAVVEVHAPVAAGVSTAGYRETSVISYQICSNGRGFALDED